MRVKVLSRLLAVVDVAFQAERAGDAATSDRLMREAARLHVWLRAGCPSKARS